jgi:hypothetical protein
MSYLNTDPSVPKEDLLSAISAAATGQAHAPGLPLIPLATLLVKVSGEASETIADLKSHITELNRKNGRLQNWVIVLAVAALLATTVQAVVAVASLMHMVSQ